MGTSKTEAQVSVVSSVLVEYVSTVLVKKNIGFGTSLAHTFTWSVGVDLILFCFL